MGSIFPSIQFNQTRDEEEKRKIVNDNFQETTFGKEDFFFQGTHANLTCPNPINKLPLKKTPLYLPIFIHPPMAMPNPSSFNSQSTSRLPTTREEKRPSSSL